MTISVPATASGLAPFNETQLADARRQAEELLSSPAFCPTDDMERETLLTRQAVLDALTDWAETTPAYFAAESVAGRVRDLCGVPDVPVVLHYEREKDAVGIPYWMAFDKLEYLLRIEQAVAIHEALALAGVTDAEKVNEITRCVVLGGRVQRGE